MTTLSKNVEGKKMYMFIDLGSDQVKVGLY